MKVVLSRKGLDSSSGLAGHSLRWSPILPDGRLVSLPIHREGEATCYEDLVIDRGRTYLDLIRELGYDYPRCTPCHRDPDIYRGTGPRPRAWRPMSGHNVPESTHLRNQGVGPGDLFLFFGLFRPTRRDSRGRLAFDGEERQLIFGYLQIHEIIPVGPDTQLPLYVRSHPHASRKARCDAGNVIYLSRATTTWDSLLPGSGVFRYDSRLVLTEQGHTKRVWRLPKCFRSAEISYHSALSWRGGLFYSACRGQEFVVQDHEGVESWAKALIGDCPRLDERATASLTRESGGL